MTFFAPAKLSDYKLLFVSLLFMVLMGVCLAMLVFRFPYRLVERSEDGLFRERVKAGSTWSIASKTTTPTGTGSTMQSRRIPLGWSGGIDEANQAHGERPTIEIRSATLNGVPVAFVPDHSLTITAGSNIDQTVYVSLMTVEIPHSGVLVVDVTDDTRHLVLVNGSIGALSLVLFGGALLFFVLAGISGSVWMFREWTRLLRRVWHSLVNKTDHGVPNGPQPGDSNSQSR